MIRIDILKEKHRVKTRPLVAAFLSVTLLSGCSDITDASLPDGVIGPSTYNNRQGALRLTQAALSELSTAVREYITSSGLMADELVANDPGQVQFDRRELVTRDIPHIVRSYSRLARGIVSKYVEGETSSWRAKLFMYEAYAEIITADGWCSGVPLSTLDFEGDWTYKRGSSTDEIYNSAISHLDSAHLLADGDDSLKAAVSVLKGRALVALGRYAEASEAVQSVGNDFRYDMKIAFDFGTGGNYSQTPKYEFFVANVSISDNEGGNGLPYRTSNDPRAKSTLLRSKGIGDEASKLNSFFPVKYFTTSDSSNFVIASGIEAILIRAEAALNRNSSSQLMDLLNTLRTDSSFTVDTLVQSGGEIKVDTVWNAGMGGVNGLRPFSAMPSSVEDQRKLLFSERAYWLFLTGTRQGDLRRLIRKYKLDSETVYPTGIYRDMNGVSNGMYENATSFSIPVGELANPLFEGCKYDE